MQLTPHEIVTRVIGPIDPTGDSTEDELRYSSLRELCTLHDQLTEDIMRAARSFSREEASMKKIGAFALAQMQEVQETLASEIVRLERF